MDATRFDVDTSRLDATLRHLARLGVRSLTSRPATLETLFLRHYANAAHAPEPAPAVLTAATR